MNKHSMVGWDLEGKGTPKSLTEAIEHAFDAMKLRDISPEEIDMFRLIIKDYLSQKFSCYMDLDEQKMRDLFTKCTLKG